MVPLIHLPFTPHPFPHQGPFPFPGPLSHLASPPVTLRAISPFFVPLQSKLTPDSQAFLMLSSLAFSLSHSQVVPALLSFYNYNGPLVCFSKQRQFSPQEFYPKSFRNAFQKLTISAAINKKKSTPFGQQLSHTFGFQDSFTLLNYWGSPKAFVHVD